MSKIQAPVIMNEAPAIDEYGVVVRIAGGGSGGGDVTIIAPIPLPVVFGAPSFDSGLTTLTDAFTVVTALTVRMIALLLVNLTTSTKLVSITNTAGAFYFKDFPLQSRNTLSFNLGQMSADGVKWKADVNGSVNAQLVGEV